MTMDARHRNYRDWMCELPVISLKVHDLRVQMQGTYCVYK